MSQSDNTRPGFSRRQALGLVLGPVFSLAVFLLPLSATIPPQALAVAAVALLMATWWVSEAIPIPATALIPIALFPALGVMGSADTTANYANHLIYLFLGGFWIAASIEKWGLHRRIALHILRLVGNRPDHVVLGFMLATAFLSMWLSNTATAMMMLPMGTAIVKETLATGDARLSAVGGQPSQPAFATALMLGIAYAASIGGVATLIGTPPNAVFAGVVETLYGQRISFAEWLVFGLPLALIMLLSCWLYLTRIAFRSELRYLPTSDTYIASELQKLGRASKQERRVLMVFCAVACAWILRGLVDFKPLALVHDSTIAITGALLLFLIPSNLARGEFLLDWKTAVRIPWDVIILFGGGFALAAGFQESGLTAWIGQQLAIFQGTSAIVLVLIVATVTIFLTELTSNTATASMLLPVIASLAAGAGIHPYGPMVAATLAASFAFMLPVATPPNAIVYASRCVSIQQMARAGFGLNLFGIVMIVLAVSTALPLLWDFSLAQFPVGFPNPR